MTPPDMIALQDREDRLYAPVLFSVYNYSVAITAILGHTRVGEVWYTHWQMTSSFLKRRIVNPRVYVYRV